MRTITQNITTYHWTHHVREKMKYYQLSEQRARRVIRNPARAEEGIASGTTAVMQPIEKQRKTTQEIWVMYQDRGQTRIVITAWRYPGKSPIRAQIPIPEDLAIEVREVLNELDRKMS